MSHGSHPSTREKINWFWLAGSLQHMGSWLLPEELREQRGEAKEQQLGSWGTLTTPVLERRKFWGKPQYMK